MNSEQDFDNEEFGKKMSEFFDSLADQMDKVEPGFRENYDEGMRVAESFHDAVNYVIANHDIVMDALGMGNFQGTTADLVAYLNIVYHAAAYSKLASDAYFFDRVIEVIKWAFLQGVAYSDVRTAPDAFSDFIEDDLNID